MLILSVLQYYLVYCDRDKTVNKINKVNLEIKIICIIKKVQYTNLYRRFFFIK